MEYTSLQKHIDQLNKLCWTCSNFISKKPGYANPKNVAEFADTIFKAYNVDVVIEDPIYFQNIYVQAAAENYKLYLVNR